MQPDNKYSGVRQQSSHWETRIRYKDKVCRTPAVAEQTCPDCSASTRLASRLAENNRRFNVLNAACTSSLPLILHKSIFRLCWYDRSCLT